MTDQEIICSITAIIAALERLPLCGYPAWVTGIGCINDLTAIKKEIEGRTSGGELSK